jgi:hypothetical protein
VTVIGVPYHLDEYLPDLDLTPEPGELITPETPAGEIWSRLAVLCAAVARAVTRRRADDGRPVVVASGDCLTALGTGGGLQAAGADPAVVWFDVPPGEHHVRRRALRAHQRGDAFVHRPAYRLAQAAPQLTTRRRDHDRFLGLGQMQHHVGDRPPDGSRRRHPLGLVQPAQDARQSFLLQPTQDARQSFLLRRQVVKDRHARTIPHRNRPMNR